MFMSLDGGMALCDSLESGVTMGVTLGIDVII